MFSSQFVCYMVRMCQQVRCSQCGKPTWSGCGRHVEQVLAHVPKDQRCQGHSSEEPKKDETGATPRKKLFGIF